MRLLNIGEHGEYSTLTDDITGSVPPYAILSHMWGADQDEVTYKELKSGVSTDKSGYKKLAFCARQSAKDHLRLCWIDTCCIDKSNSAELNEAINSMFKWYRQSKKCYVFLADVHTGNDDPSSSDSSWLPQFRTSRWFSRGWTLQELLAPLSVEFFCAAGKKLGDKVSLEHELSEITGIPVQALRGMALSTFPTTEKFSWVKNRQTKREEDMAYSMLGIFNVYIPLIYGEGKSSALRRLTEEVDRRSPSIVDINSRTYLPDVPDAPFNAYQRQHEPLCLDGTRTQMLSDIFAWGDNNEERALFWLQGLAGTGKSTISRTVARQYFNKRRLGASFFFSRDGGDVGHAGKFVTTIALQLATSIPGLQSHILDAVKERPDIASRSLHDQWNELVFRPISRLIESPGSSPYIIVVDALDECANESDVQALLHLLSQARLLSNIRLRIFLTSRPEVPIRSGFSHVPHTGYKDFVLHNIDVAIVDNDIHTFLVHSFTIIRHERRDNDASWPGENVINNLVSMAGGLFIWAATACRFIREGKRFAPTRLKVILESTEESVNAPEKHLDEIYTTVLRHTILPEYSNEERTELCALLKKILGSIVVLLSPISIITLSKLINVPQEATDQTLDELHSILDIPCDRDQPLRLHHPSFRDFLVSSKRCADHNFRIDEIEIHEMLLNRCIDLMSRTLEQDICGFQHSGIELEDADVTRVDKRIPRELRYACLYWMEHLSKSRRTLQDHDSVHQFLERHLLHWLEALTWLGKVSQAIYAIEAFIHTVGCPKLGAFMHDARRFVTYNRSAFEKNPLQLYSSALLFTPQMSLVKTQFLSSIPRWIGSLPRVHEDWSALIHTLEGHHSEYWGMCFSNNNKLLASATFSGEIRICDADTGIERMILRLKEEPIRKLSFSPNDSSLAVSSGHRKVQLLDVASGAERFDLIGHEDIINVIRFSSNGNLLATGSNDKRIKLWNTNEGTIVHTFAGHQGKVVTINFLRGGALLGTTSTDTSQIKVWDVSTGTLLETRGPFDEVSAPVAVSSSGRLLLTRPHSDETTISLWNTETGVKLHRWRGREEIECAEFSPGEEMLVTGSFAIIKLWNVVSGGLERTFEGHKSWISQLLVSPNGRMLASASNDQSIKLWDLALALRPEEDAQGHSSWVNCIAFSPDSSLVATASHDHTLQLWNAKTSESKILLRSHDKWISDIVISPTNHLLAAAGDQSVKLWDLDNYQDKITLEGRDDWMTNVIFSYDSKLLASVSINRKVYIWDVATGTLQFTTQGNNIRLESPRSFSAPSIVDTKVTFFNASDFKVHCFWIDMDGKSKHYWTLRPKMEVTQPTYVGHFWRFVNAATSQAIGGYTCGSEHVTCTFTNDDLAILEGGRQYLLDVVKQSGFWSSSSVMTDVEPQTALQVLDDWITLTSGKKLVWLPDEYRPTHYRMKNDILVLGHASGQVTFLNIKVDVIQSRRKLQDYFPSLAKRDTTSSTIDRAQQLDLD